MIKIKYNNQEISEEVTFSKVGIATKEYYADEVAYTETLRQKIRKLEDK